MKRFTAEKRTDFSAGAVTATKQIEPFIYQPEPPVKLRMTLSVYMDLTAGKIEANLN